MPRSADAVATSFFAHETWFTDMTPADWSFTFEAATLALLGLAVVVTLAVRMLAVRSPDLLGLACFVLLTGPGRWSADLELGRAFEPSL